jgi:hypothetical protein
LFIFGFLYLIFLTFDALRLRSNMGIFTACLLNCGLLSYAAIQRTQIKAVIASLAKARDSNKNPLVHLDMDIWDTISPILITIPCIIGAVTAVLLALASKVNDEFAWVIYKQLGGDLQMKNRLIAFQVRYSCHQRYSSYLLFY